MNFYIPSEYKMRLKDLDKTPMVDPADRPPVLLYKNTIKYHTDFPEDTVEILSVAAGKENDEACYEVSVMFNDRSNIYLQGLYQTESVRIFQRARNGKHIYGVYPEEDKKGVAFELGRLTFQDLPGRRQYTYTVRLGQNESLSLADVLIILQDKIMPDLYKQ